VRSALPALIAALALAAPPAIARAAEASLPDIEDEVMCPICGTTLELSESPQAERERQLIRRLIDRGQSKGEIKDALVAEYGEEVLADPASSGFDLTAWIIPVLGIAIAISAMAVAVRRRSWRTSQGAEEIDPSDAAWLERDMSSREL
jgi:cytochrome c-type biogenesis protein CcmH